MTDATTQKDFFISHSGRDTAWAEWIAWQLQAAGYLVVLDKWHFGAGSNIPLEMHRALQECTRTIIVLSENYLQGTYTHPEWAAVFWKDPKGEERRLIPIQITDCEPDGLLAPLMRIDIRGLNETRAHAKILDELKRGVPDIAPVFPGEAQPSLHAGTRRFPGKLPEIWNLPFLRNPNFTGRDEILVKLRETLRTGSAAALTALFGLGGIGKTQVALEYAYRFHSDYDLIWWVKAETEASRVADIEALARELKLPEVGQKSEVVREAVKKWLRNANEKWLMIFDNAPNPEELKSFLPNGGHVLITSRYQAWGGTAEPLEVEKMDKGEAREFLLKRTRQEDVETADALAEELGYLPLALEQAGAYMEKTSKSLPEYLELYRNKKTAIFNSGLAKPSQDYPDTVSTTWTLSFEAAEAQCKEAGDLLRLCAFFAPDDIPLDVIVDGAEFLPETLAACVKDETKLDEAIAVLKDYSLVTRNEKGLSIHRLVQEVTRDRLSEDEQKLWARVAVEIVGKVFPNAERIENWPTCDRLLLHGLSIVAHVDNHEEVQESTRFIYNQCGGYLNERARYVEAKFCFERARDLAEVLYGKDDPKVAISVNNLGNVLRAQGNLEGAKQCSERALKLWEKELGENHPKVAIGVNNLGLVLKAQGDLEGAKKYFERALKIGEATYGKDHPKVAIRVNNLGGVLRAQGDLEGAKKYFERALRIDEAVYGKDHPDIAIDVNNLGLVLKDQGDLEGAKQCYERALKIWTKYLGVDHPSTKIAQGNLDLLLEKMKRKV